MAARFEINCTNVLGLACKGAALQSAHFLTVGREIGTITFLFRPYVWRNKNNTFWKHLLSRVMTN